MHIVTHTPAPLYNNHVKPSSAKQTNIETGVTHLLRMKRHETAVFYFDPTKHL